MPSAAELEQAAWTAYLTATREAEPEGYELLEEWAWSRLQASLEHAGTVLVAV